MEQSAPVLINVECSYAYGASLLRACYHRTIRVLDFFPYTFTRFSSFFYYSVFRVVLICSFNARSIIIVVFLY